MANMSDMCPCKIRNIFGVICREGQKWEYLSEGFRRQTQYGGKRITMVFQLLDSLLELSDFIVNGFMKMVLHHGWACIHKNDKCSWNASGWDAAGHGPSMFRLTVKTHDMMWQFVTRCHEREVAEARLKPSAEAFALPWEIVLLARCVNPMTHWHHGGISMDTGITLIPLLVIPSGKCISQGQMISNHVECFTWFDMIIEMRVSFYKNQII